MKPRSKAGEIPVTSRSFWRRSWWRDSHDRRAADDALADFGARFRRALPMRCLSSRLPETARI